MNNERLCDHTLFMRSILVGVRDISHGRRCRKQWASDRLELDDHSAQQELLLMMQCGTKK